LQTTVAEVRTGLRIGPEPRLIAAEHRSGPRDERRCHRFGAGES
jgi:hypothetical protein